MKFLFAGSNARARRMLARFNRVRVCFGYNDPKGCKRLAPGTVATKCQDAKNKVFAHVCNAYLKSMGDYCFASHPKYGNR